MDGTLKEIIGEERYLLLVELSVSERIDELRKIALGLENGKSLSILQSKIVLMMQAERRYDTHLESTNPTIRPEDFNVFITDINDEDLINISTDFGRSYLSSPLEQYVFPVDGVLYGSNLRIFFPLTVEEHRKSINVLFLADTGSPCTYLRKDTFEKLGHTEFILSEVSVKINGTVMKVHLSHGHFHNVNLLGQDYMRAAKLQAYFDYEELTASLGCRKSTSRIELQQRLEAAEGSRIKINTLI